MCDRGFTLLEVLIALAVLAAGALATAQVIVTATTDLRDARFQTVAAALAAQRMEQLLALDWTCDADGDPVSDLETNLAVTPASTGGPGLSISPPDALESNVPGYVDFLGADGAWLSAAADPPAGAAYVRRWAVDPFPADPEDTRLLRVVVRPLAAELAGARGGRGEARLVTLRTRVWR